MEFVKIVLVFIVLCIVLTQIKPFNLFQILIDLSSCRDIYEKKRKSSWDCQKLLQF